MSASRSPHESHFAFQQGERHLSLGNIEHALECFESALAWDFKNSAAYEARGLLAEKQNDHCSARYCYSKAAEVSRFSALADYEKLHQFSEYLFKLDEQTESLPVPVETILKPEFWPAFPRYAVKDVSRVKMLLTNSIIALADKVLKQKILWQALLPQTFLGSFFHKRQGVFTPGLTGGNLQRLASELRLEVIQSDVLHIDAETLQAWRGAPTLLGELARTFPMLYQKLV
jgi:tetratricopeptide (TPR) repeat protein